MRSAIRSAIRGAIRGTRVLTATVLSLTALTAATVSCTARSVTGVVEDEPLCVDFMLGGSTLMKGALQQPVKLSVLEDDDVRWERVLLGRRSASGEASRFVVKDDDETYTIRWAQCPNRFAPKRVAIEGRSTDNAVGYTCGEPKTYSETQLEVREGDAKSRVLKWAAPPNAACWEGSTAPEPEGSASAGDEDPPEPAPESSATPESKCDRCRVQQARGTKETRGGAESYSATKTHSGAKSCATETRALTGTAGSHDGG